MSSIWNFKCWKTCLEVYDDLIDSLQLLPNLLLSHQNSEVTYSMVIFFILYHTFETQA